jgi:dTDP-4-dehydrorhamnose reductase
VTTVLVFGRGFLGRRFARELPGATLHAADICDQAAVRAALAEHRPEAVINAAGKTGRPNVDWCETHQEETLRSNVEGALVLARECARAGAYLLHLASGCIFYGPSPSPGGWREDDFANPKAFYSRTKFAADLVLSRLPNVGVARLRLPVDHEPSPRNLITKLSTYPRVSDVANSVTVVDDLVSVAAALIEKRGVGVFHVTNPGALRHRDLLALYRELVDPKHVCELIDEEQLVPLGLASVGRSNCLMASENLSKLGIRMRSIDVALRDTMTRYAEVVQGSASRSSARRSTPEP